MKSAVFQLAPKDPGKQDPAGGAEIEVPNAWGAGLRLEKGIHIRPGGLGAS